MKGQLRKMVAQNKYLAAQIFLLGKEEKNPSVPRVLRAGHIQSYHLTVGTVDGNNQKYTLSKNQGNKQTNQPPQHDFTMFLRISQAVPGLQRPLESAQEHKKYCYVWHWLHM